MVLSQADRRRQSLGCPSQAEEGLAKAIRTVNANRWRVFGRPCKKRVAKGRMLIRTAFAGTACFTVEFLSPLSLASDAGWLIRATFRRLTSQKACLCWIVQLKRKRLYIERGTKDNPNRDTLTAESTTARLVEADREDHPKG